MERKIVLPKRRRRRLGGKLGENWRENYFRLADGDHVIEVGYARALVSINVRQEWRRRPGVKMRHGACFQMLHFLPAEAEVVAALMKKFARLARKIDQGESAREAREAVSRRADRSRRR